MFFSPPVIDPVPNVPAVLDICSAPKGNSCTLGVGLAVMFAADWLGLIPNATRYKLGLSKRISLFKYYTNLNNIYTYLYKVNIFPIPYFTTSHLTQVYRSTVWLNDLVTWLKSHNVYFGNRQIIRQYFHLLIKAVAWSSLESHKRTTSNFK